MNLLKKLSLDEAYVFSGSAYDLERLLLSSTEPKVKRIGRQEYSLTPSYSVGTLMLQGMKKPLMEIEVFTSVTGISTDHQQVNFTTTPRVEHFFIGIIFLIFIVVVATQGESLWLYPFLIILWGISHLWFQSIYRAQEEEVVDKIVRRLRLIEKGSFQLPVP